MGELFDESYRITLSVDEKTRCLEEIITRLKKILYVYDKSLENKGYNYKVYCGGVALYVSSSNMLFNGDLVSILVNVNSIMTENLSKPQIKKLVFDSINNAKFLLEALEALDDKETDKGEE